jgi:alpha-beta hydrolase superfamily lysophospholipase
MLSGKLHLPVIYTGKDLSHDPERANDFDSDTLIPNFITVGMAKEVVEASHRVRGLSYYMRIPSLFLIAGNDKIVDAESTAIFAHGIEKRLTQVIHYPSHYHELWNEIDRFEIFETMKKWIEKTLKENP